MMNILKKAKEDRNFRKKLIQKLSSTVVLPPYLKEDLQDAILYSHGEGRKKFLLKYLKGLSRNIEITYLSGKDEPWNPEIRFLYKNKDGEYFSNKYGEPIELEFSIDYGKGRLKKSTPY